MLLKDYFPNLNKKYHDLSFKGIAFNSKEVKEGYIFFAFKGNNTDGNLFIKDAIKNGSKIIISDKLKENGWKNNILFLNFKDPRKLLAIFSSRIFHKKPNKEFVYNYRDGRQPYKGNWRNTAGWTTVWVTGQIIDKIGPILATKY